MNGAKLKKNYVQFDVMSCEFDSVIDQLLNAESNFERRRINI